jgi:hypothetical protein
MSHPEQSGQETAPNFQDEQLGRFQRLEALQNLENGFLPVTTQETTEAISLVAFRNKLGGAAKHLAEVVTHQRKAGVQDPMSAARSKTRSYIEYAEDAKSAAHDLQLLQTELDEVLNPELRINRVLESNQTGLLPFFRWSSINEFVALQGVSKEFPYDPQQLDYSPNNGGITYYLDLATEKWSVHQVRQHLPDAIVNESNRLQFWTQSLEKVQQYFPQLSPIVTEGLDKLYDRQAS